VRFSSFAAFSASFTSFGGSDIEQVFAKEQKAEVVTHCDHLQRLKFSPTLPYAFTEHGAVMLANVLNRQVAVQVSIQVVRAFIRLREAVASHKDLGRRLDQLEKKYDAQFKAVFDAIRQLITPPEPKKRKIGFIVKGGAARYGRPEITVRR